MESDRDTFAADISKSLTRREFLIFGGVGLISFLFPQQIKILTPAREEHGRILENGTKLFDVPSLKGKELATYWKDTVVPISEATVGDTEPDYNRIWYVIQGEGYAHSGGIQPVRTQLNPVVTEIPEGGILGEVTVPFTDAHWRADKNVRVAYRLYYETTHWVTGLVKDSRDNPWYCIAEDKWKLRYYAPAEHMRLIPDDELAPISAHLPNFAKRIEVRTKEQVVIAYEWNKAVFMAKTATGAKFSNGNFATPPGRHITAYKRHSRHMAAGNLAYNGYDLPGVPWISYITESGISFHGTYWHNNYGRPRSHGCINLTSKAAKWLFLWSMPYVSPSEQYVQEDFGTIVDVI